MKKIKFNNSIISISLILFFGLIISCHQRTILDDEYSDFRRVMGPDGGEINFYKYYSKDTVPEQILKMNFPQGALDSLVVFNMYEYTNENSFLEVYLIGVHEQSAYLYFVPYPESLGYNEYANDTTFQNHFSVPFKKPVTITYKVNDYGYEDSLKLFKVKIPKINEWGVGDENNVWINLNQQGYPDGYQSLDLLYLITGRWTEFDEWGLGSPSLINWEEVTEFSLNQSDTTITFDIDDTDHMYLMGYKNMYYKK